MIHDYAHCIDYNEGCPEWCFRGKLIRDLKPGDIVSWTHLENTAECPKHQTCQHCDHNLRLERWDYTKVGTGQEWKEKCDGHVCTVFADEGIAVWKIGADDGKCEMWTERKKHERTDVQT